MRDFKKVMTQRVKSFVLVLIRSGFSILNSMVYANKSQTYVEAHTGSSQIQGLKYIKISAHTLMISYNEKHKTKWQALEQNVKSVLARCRVPIKASYWSIVVQCDHAVTIGKESQTWNAILITTRPYIQAKVKILDKK